jgi:hypothetical protein
VAYTCTVCWGLVSPPAGVDSQQQQEGAEGMQGLQQLLDSQCRALSQILCDTLGQHDVSHWVRSAAAQAAGAMICNMPRSVKQWMGVCTCG